MDQQSLFIEPFGSTEDKFTYRLATSVNDLLAAWSFTYEKYLELGLCKPNVHGLWAYPSYISPQSLTTMCFSEGKLVGTCSTVIDGPAGLPLDSQFPRELAAWRAIGQRLNESGLLAVDREQAPRDCALQLHIHSGAFACLQGHPLFIGGIHPQRKRFYAEHLGFGIIGDTEVYGKMQSAPVVLQFMHMEQVDFMKYPLLAETHRLAQSPSFAEKVSKRVILTDEVIASSPLSAFRHSFVSKQSA